MSYWNQFLWVIFPYMMIAVTIIGHIYRYSTDQMNWTSRSSEFLEKKSLRWGSLLFHYGIIFVFFGHVLGLLIPESFITNSIGINNETYHQIAISFGGIAGTATIVGAFILLFRRYGNKRISKTSSFGDKFIIVLLFLLIAIGIYNTLFYNLAVGDFNYRLSISPWVRSLFVFSPDSSLMANIPLTYKIHVLLAFLTIGVWPFTRLVHVWSIPVAYIKRSHIIYRRRCDKVK
jgi:nitrate reductase gamma subunit